MLLFFICLAWGLNLVLTRWVVTDLQVPPLFFAAVRFAGVALFLIPFMALLLWFGYDFAARSFVRGETSNGGVGLSHRWIIKSAIPLAAVLAILGGLSVGLRCLVALFRPDLRRDPFEAD